MSHYFSNGNHLLSILTIAASLGALIISIINTRRGHFDLMVKKYDLVFPVYVEKIDRIEVCHAAFTNVVNSTRRLCILALDSNHPEHSQGNAPLRQYRVPEKQFEIEIDPKLPSHAQGLLKKINSIFEEGLKQLNETAHSYQNGLLTQERYIDRNKKWAESADALGIQIIEFKQFCKTDLENLTKGIRRR